MDELGRQRERGELALAIAFLAMVGLGAWLHATLLTLFGALGALGALVLYLWQRCCLMRLTYRREVTAERVVFGETILLTMEIVNDKILPLPWVRVIDLLPRGLLPADHPSAQPKLQMLGSGAAIAPHLIASVHSFALLPFSRLTRRIELLGARRGRYHFSSTEITSGDPLGIRPRSFTVDAPHVVIVYPKLLTIEMLSPLSRTPLGDERTRRKLLGDPTRVAGMRPYRTGDPLRHIDWRATARRAELLVRDFEPTTTLSLIIFLDTREVHEGSGGIEMETPAADCPTTAPSEFAISLAASIILWSTTREIPTGLYATGRSDEMVMGDRALTGVHATASLLEQLAVLAPDAEANFPLTLDRGARSLGAGTSAIVISPHFDPATVAAIAGMRRRSPVTAIHLAGTGGMPPPPGSVDDLLSVTYSPNWQEEAHALLH